jgi:glycosyltransferase involved in cell wall biosynthesis
VDNSDDDHVKILLSTFDGEAFLDELIESIQSQSFTQWSLVCRDDGSSDGTRQLLDGHAAADDRITVLPDDGDRLGPAASFMKLLACVDEAMFAFCDQDDIWEPHKLAWSVGELRRAQSPISGVYTDAFIADADARVVAPSALARRRVAYPPPFAELLMVNAAIGATFLGTAELARTAVEIGDDPWMHDWWCALVAAYAGELRLVPFPTLRWRRHVGTVTNGPVGPTPVTRARRLDYVEWSSRAAYILAESHIDPVDSAVARAAAMLGEMYMDGLSVRGMCAADRVGVRAWPLRRRLAVFVSIGLRRLGRMA